MYQQLAEEFHHLMCTHRPLELIRREDFSRVDELPDTSSKAKEEYASECLLLADRIREQKNGINNIDGQLDLELAENTLCAEALETTALINGVPKHAVHPTALVDLFELTPIFLERDPRQKSAIVDSFISRLNQFGEYLSKELTRLDRPVMVMVKREIEAGESFESLLRGVQQFASGIGYKKMIKLSGVSSTALEQVTRYLNFLRVIETRTKLSVGPEVTKQLLRHKGIEIMPQEMYALALEQLRSTSEELIKVKESLTKKYCLDSILTVLDVAEILKTKFRHPEGKVVEEATKLLNKAKGFAYGRGIVIPLVNESAKIVTTPGYIRPTVPIAAMAPPGTFCKGERKSIFYITEFGGIERALNRLNVPVITAHELIPGHHYQFCRAIEHSSKIRAWLQPQDTIEGWATYVAEQLMVQEGYAGNDELKNEEKFMALIDQLRFGARVCFVLACMTGDRSYLKYNGETPVDEDLISASTKFYMKVTSFQEERARGDVELFYSLSTYGTLYLIGNKLIRDLEAAAHKKQGSSFKRLNFLEAVLQEGMMPLSYIERALKHKEII